MKRRSLIASVPASMAVASSAWASSAPINIAFWHAMGGALGDILQTNVNKFNASQKEFNITATYKGTYSDLLTATITAWRAGKAPAIAQVFDVGTADMLRAGRAVMDVYKLSEMTGVKIDPETYIPAVRDYYSLNNGNMGAAPFNSSTALTWINEDIFKKAGLDPETPLTTWDDIVKAARVIKAKGACEIPVTTTWPSWVHFEQFASIHNIEYATMDDGFAGKDPELKITTAPFHTHMHTLLSMQKEKLFFYEGRSSKSAPIFYAGQAAITFGSSSERGQLAKSAQFKFSNRFLPYYPSINKNPINSIIGGAALWAMTAPGRTKDEYRGVANFFNFLAQPEMDASWAEQTGYVPITVAGNALIEKSGYYAKNPGSDTAVKQLTRTAPTKLSRGIRLSGLPEIRSIIEEEWEQAIQNGTPADKVLAQAQSRGQAVINRLARA